MNRAHSQPRAFTLFEILIVVVILGIVAAIFVPAAGNNIRSSRLRTAANVLAADIEFCQSECITRPSDARGLQFDTTNNKYSVISLATSAAISHPADSLAYTNDFATGRNLQLSGVTITSVTSGGSAATLLTYDQYGKPLITSTFIIQLSFNGSLMNVTVDPTTGDVGIVDAGQAATGNDNGQNKDNGNGQKNGV